MDATLSTYWVKFFKAAGFPQDVATRHAVVFSNNRIKPDMLPDLDKPSLKEMGITLMGDMIAILRYAKKVVEETTCERFLVDSEDTSSVSQTSVKTVVKKVMKEPIRKTVVTGISKTEPTKKIVRCPSTTLKKIVSLKKPVLNISTDHTEQKKQTPIKRKLISQDEYEEKKKIKTTTSTEDTTFSVGMSQVSSIRPAQILKKSMEQKRTVFDRLGDSSVTSTTSLTDTAPTFNITGIGKDVFKRSASVFKRLGDKDEKKDSLTTAGILKNGSNSSSSLSILRGQISNTRTIVTTKRDMSKNTGTMHADHEVNKKITSSNKNRIIKIEERIAYGASNKKVIKPTISGKLASERLTFIPAKERLGTTTPKQVTFSKVTTVTRLKKPDVFSRLGV